MCPPHSPSPCTHTHTRDSALVHTLRASRSPSVCKLRNAHAPASRHLRFEQAGEQRSSSTLWVRDDVRRNGKQIRVVALDVRQVVGLEGAVAVVVAAASIEGVRFGRQGQVGKHVLQVRDVICSKACHRVAERRVRGRVDPAHTRLGRRSRRRRWRRRWRRGRRGRWGWRRRNGGGWRWDPEHGRRGHEIRRSRGVRQLVVNRVGRLHWLRRSREEHEERCGRGVRLAGGEHDGESSEARRGRVEGDRVTQPTAGALLERARPSLQWEEAVGAKKIVRQRSARFDDVGGLEREAQRRESDVAGCVDANLEERIAAEGHLRDIDLSRWGRWGNGKHGRRRRRRGDGRRRAQPVHAGRGQHLRRRRVVCQLHRVERRDPQVRRRRRQQDVEGLARRVAAAGREHQPEAGVAGGGRRVERGGVAHPTAGPRLEGASARLEREEAIGAEVAVRRRGGIVDGGISLE
mmetsp:Transcript_31340/g.92193  ORF Transcript_31340/g.92193 Transcript_31340/m.92193 type:complete len:462 (-) Transcript_31340:241-1626(-)